MREHVYYEKDLKFFLRDYVKREDVQMERSQTFHTADDIIRFIVKTHKEYLKALKVVHEDVHFIINLCYKVVDAILMFFQMAFRKLEFGLMYEEKILLDYSKI
jgi:hypothetical protein